MSEWMGMILMFGGVFGIALAGWNTALHLKFRASDRRSEAIEDKMKSFSKIWAWKDQHEKDLAEYKIQIVRDYATKQDVAVGFDKIEQHLTRVETKVDELREEIAENRRGGN